MQLHFATAALGSKYYPAASRLLNQVENCLTENVHCLTEINYESKIDNKYIKILKNKEINSLSSFIWKPWYILSILNKLNDDDVLFYLDAGCELSPSAFPELNRVLSLAQESSLFFSNKLSNLEWCSSAILKILGTKIIDHESAAAGVMILKKDIHTVNLIRKWACISLYKKGLFFHGNEEKRHRHDQFVLSLLLSESKTKLFDYPIWFPDWAYAFKTPLEFPIHTLRNKSSISILSIQSSGAINLLRKLRLPNKIILNISRLDFQIKRIFQLIFQRQFININLLDINKVRIPGHSNYYKKTFGDTSINNDRFKVVNHLIHNAIIDSNGIVKHSAGYIYDYSRQFGPKPLSLTEGISLNPNLKVSINAATLCLNFDSDNLYHFLYDCLANVNYDNASDSTLLISEGLNKIKTGIFGINKLQFVYVKPGRKYLIDDLLLYDLNSYSGSPSSESIYNLKKYFSFVNLIRSDVKRIVINRKNEHGRRINFTKDQTQLLKEFGFKEFYLEDLSFVEQCAIFAYADFIISPHGAGLSWIFLCHPKATIIEIFNGIYTNYCFKRISDALKIDHICITGDAEFNKRRPDESNININEATFKRIFIKFSNIVSSDQALGIEPTNSIL
jgi:hypothetical protein